MIKSRELAVLVYLSHTEDEAVRPQGAIALGEQTALAVHSVSSPAQINAVLPQVDARWCLLVSEHENITPEVLDQFRHVLAESPDTRLFFLQDDVDHTLVNKPLSPFAEQLCALSPFGLLFEKRFLQELGGLNEKLTHAFDMDLFSRCTQMEAPPVAGIPKHTFTAIGRQAPANTLGADRVAQACDLAAGLQGKASGYWFASMANRIEQQLAQLPETDIERVKLHVHLAGLAYRIAHQVVQGDQALFAPYLKRSIYDGTQGVRDVSLEVDRQVEALFERPPQPLLLPEALHCFALGQTPQCAQLLKQLGLKRVTGPLDWVNLNAPAVAHVLNDGFKELLNPAHCKGSDGATGGMGSMLRTREHVFYRDEFGVKNLFSFHDLNRSADLAQYKQAVEVMENALKWDTPTLSIYLSSSHEPGVWANTLFETLSRRGPKNALLYIDIVRATSDEDKEAGKGLILESLHQGAVVKATLPVFSEMTGSVFADAVDNVRLARLVHGVALGMFGNA